MVIKKNNKKKENCGRYEHMVEGFVNHNLLPFRRQRSLGG